jgi:hypothetical protein
MGIFQQTGTNDGCYDCTTNPITPSHALARLLGKLQATTTTGRYSSTLLIIYFISNIHGDNLLFA